VRKKALYRQATRGVQPMGLNPFCELGWVDIIGGMGWIGFNHSSHGLGWAGEVQHFALGWGGFGLGSNPLPNLYRSQKTEKAKVEKKGEKRKGNAKPNMKKGGEGNKKLTLKRRKRANKKKTN
jgi:hypothetical protein